MDWLIDLINDNGHLAWVRIPGVGEPPVQMPAHTWHWDRTDSEEEGGERYMLISHPDLQRVYKPEDIPIVRYAVKNVAEWEIVE